MSDLVTLIDELRARVGTKEARVGAEALAAELDALRAGVKSGKTTEEEAMLTGIGLLERALRLAVDLAVQADAKARRTVDANIALEGQLAGFKSKEVGMLTKEKRAFLIKMLGPEKVEQIEKGLISLAKELEEAGIDYKDLNDCMNGVCADKGQKLPEPRRAFLIRLLGLPRVLEIEAAGPKSGLASHWGTDPTGDYVQDLRRGRRDLTQAQKEGVKQLDASGGVGPYVGDLARGVLPGGE
jgi:hypothetical protein